MDTSVECGLDEAGRGPLAGPVTAGCVLLPVGFPLEILADSKTLSEKRREKAYEVIIRGAAWGVGWSDAREIDELNILQASLKAMKRAYLDLRVRFPSVRIETAVVDGLFAPELGIPCRTLVKADSLIPSVSAASIVAKVLRDRLMREAHLSDPRYGFGLHKGYPTRAHRQALEQYGPSPLHRLSFQWKPAKP